MEIDASEFHYLLAHADSTDAQLRNVENSFLLGPLLICAR